MSDRVVALRSKPAGFYLWSGMFILSALWLGLAAGTALGGRYLVPKGSGLAGPAEAFMYGLMFALLCAAAAGLAIRFAPPRLVFLAGKAGLVLSLLLVAFVTVRVFQDISRQVDEPEMRTPTKPVAP